MCIRDSINQHPALAAHGLDAPLHFDGSDLAAHLKALHEHGVRSVFVEGGPTVASAFIAAGLADEVLVYVAPALQGGPRLAVGDPGIESMVGIRRLSIEGVERLGDGLLIRGTVATAAATAPTATPPTHTTTTASVSYTHLNVYKRQHAMCLPVTQEHYAHLAVLG